ncbi:MAG: GrpB family protein [Candidatus Micrarchaeales archaeon]|nr:GrpB family protein [Candidatus Micrarchaeales archaeon]
MVKPKHHRYIPGKKKYVFRKASTAYAKTFKTEKARLSKCIKGDLAAIEHVGSTAVPGLGGKNILDILVGIKKPDRRALKGMLEELGYDFMPEAGSQRRLFFVRDARFEGKQMRIHLHLVKFEGTEWKQKISFRDYLRKHKELVKEYERVKKEAVKKANGNKEAYLKAKSRFIDSVTRKALGRKIKS